MQFGVAVSEKEVIALGDAKALFSEETAQEILRILNQGDTVELKREKGNLVVVQIRRKVKIKTAAIG